ncbi:MAG: hypothetical protein ABFD89_05840 [Bryobacteraceae bacterium]
MADITDILDRIQAEADAATKGPWTRSPVSGVVGSLVEAWDGGLPSVNVAAVLPAPACADNADLIAHARANVPRLVAAMRVLVEAVERMSRESMDETMGLVADETLGEAQAILEGRDDVS